MIRLILQMPAAAAKRLQKLWSAGGPEADALKAQGIENVTVRKPMRRTECLLKLKSLHGDKATCWRRGPHCYGGFRYVIGTRPRTQTATTWYWRGKTYDEILQKAAESKLLSRNK